jgi:hypothetical protein
MSLIHTQGIGDLWRMHAITKRDNVDFNLAYIGSDFKCEYNHDFDTNFMRALFEYGQGLAKKGYPWEKHPPGFDG